MTPAHVGAGLRRDAIDWKQVPVLSVAGCGPASVIALYLRFMGAFAGAALVLAFPDAIGTSLAEGDDSIPEPHPAHRHAPEKGTRT